MNYEEKYNLQIKVNADLHDLIKKLTQENDKLKSELDSVKKELAKQGKVVETNSVNGNARKGIVEFG